MDQQLAGGVLLLVGTPLVLAAIGVIFFRWQGESDAVSVVQTERLD